MLSIVKLGVAIGVGYTYGGVIGQKVAGVIKSDLSEDARMGAVWAGRITTFAALSALLSRV